MFGTGAKRGCIVHRDLPTVGGDPPELAETVERLHHRLARQATPLCQLGLGQAELETGVAGTRVGPGSLHRLDQPGANPAEGIGADELELTSVGEAEPGDDMGQQGLLGGGVLRQELQESVDRHGHDLDGRDRGGGRRPSGAVDGRELTEHRTRLSQVENELGAAQGELRQLDGARCQPDDVERVVALVEHDGAGLEATTSADREEALEVRSGEPGFPVRLHRAILNHEPGLHNGWVHVLNLLGSGWLPRVRGHRTMATPRRKETEMSTFDLNELKLFSGCSKRQLRKLLRLTTGAVVPAGQVLMAQGEPGRECMIVCSGTVSVIHDGEVIHRSGPGEILGEAALLGDGARRSATAVTDTECSVLVMDRREFASLAEEVPQVWVRINKAAITHLAEALEHDPAAA